MKKRFALLILLVWIALLGYGQNSEKISDIHTDIDCYYKVGQLQATVTLQQSLIEKLAADTVDWKAKCDRQEATTDSVLYEKNLMQTQVKNVVANCQKSLERKSTWESIFKYAALVSVPVAIVSTGLLIIK